MKHAPRRRAFVSVRRPPSARVLAFALCAGLLGGASAHAQRAPSASANTEVEFPVQVVTALVDRPSYKASPRFARGDRLGKRHGGRIPLRASFRARAAASAWAF